MGKLHDALLATRVLNFEIVHVDFELNDDIEGRQIGNGHGARRMLKYLSNSIELARKLMVAKLSLGASAERCARISLATWLQLMARCATGSLTGLPRDHSADSPI